MIKILMEETLRHKVVTQHKPQEKMSASSFPQCSIALVTQFIHQKYSGFRNKQATTLLGIFAGAGTAMHKAIQDGMGYSGRLYGNYCCANYKCDNYIDTSKFRPKLDNPKLFKNTTDNICPKCGRGMSYVELEINDPIIDMYIDIVLRFDDGTFGVYDLKSCTSRAAKEKSDTDLVTHAYRSQVRSYAVEVERRLELPVSRYGLIYIPRDNPLGHRLVEWEFTDKEASESYAVYKDERRKYKLAHKAVDNPLASIKGRLCHGTGDHDKFFPYEPCPLNPLCFMGSRELDKFFTKFEAFCKANPETNYFDALAAVRDGRGSRVKVVNL